MDEQTKREQEIVCKARPSEANEVVAKTNSEKKQWKQKRTSPRKFV